MRFMKPVALRFVVAVGVMPWTVASAQAPVPASTPAKVGSAAALTAETFDRYQKQIRPQPGESRWLEVAWFTDLHEARRKAAAEGKPLFVYASGGATGIGAC